MNYPKEDKIDYNRSKEKFLTFLEAKENAIMVLATSADNVVMARSVLIFNNDLDIYFFTWNHSRKCAQIANNNMVSLCKDKIEIEGKAEILGLMTSEENKNILEMLRKKQPNAVKRWENKPNMVIVRIQPTFAAIDGYYIDNDAYIEYIDFKKKIAYRLKWGYN
jgi:general stress protein 26